MKEPKWILKEGVDKEEIKSFITSLASEYGEAVRNETVDYIKSRN